MPNVSLDRADLERLTSAATAFAALQRLTALRGGPTIPVRATVDGASVDLGPETLAAEMAALESAVVRTRRLLGWRR
jgi:hypothetical protein